MTALRAPKQRLTPKPPILTSRQKKHNRNAPDLTKLLHVSVTLISLSGVYFKESSDAKNTDDEALASNPSYPKTTIVASFSRIDGKEANLDYHVRSLPLDLSTAPTKDAYKEVIRWPTQAGNDNENLSTIQFERCFVREKRGNSRKSKKKGQHLYTPQSCQIQLAVCRNGRWFKLGDADVMITGEERGDESVAVPLIKQDRPNTKKSKSNIIPMARLKGESLACGLGPNAALRVLINVSEHPNEEKILDHSLVKVSSWEYDPVRAAVVEKISIEKSPARVDGQAITIVVAAGKGSYEISDQEEKESENRATIIGDVQVSPATESIHTNQEPSEDSETANVPPIRQDSSLSKHEDISPIRQSSTSSKPGVLLDRVTTVDSHHSSPQASASNRALGPIRGFSPIRVSSPMRTLTPFRTSASIRQRSVTDSLKKTGNGSVLDRVVTITSNSPSGPREGSLSDTHSSSPPHDPNIYDQSVFYIEHDMQPGDEIPSSPPVAKDICSAQSKSSITVSTTEQSRSHLSAQSECSEFLPSGLTLARCSTGNTSTFSHSQNSGFTSASGYSLTMCSTDNLSMDSHASGDMSVVMAELLEKTPSELYAIIHDIDPDKAQRLRLSSRKLASHACEEDDDDEDCESEVYESVGESTALHERDDESSLYSCSESWSSVVERRQNGQSVRGNFLTDKARSFGRRFICSIPMCGIGARDDKTLSCVDESVTFLTGKGDILACRQHDINDTWIGSSSSSFIGSNN
ncbi:hypothetical protein ACHAW6_008859 [Cyclotella cf. meneghiniana]